MSIFIGFIPHLWVVLEHMPTLNTPIAGISTSQALTSMQTDTLTTRLAVKLGISIMPFLGPNLFLLAVLFLEGVGLPKCLCPFFNLGLY